MKNEVICVKSWSLCNVSQIQVLSQRQVTSQTPFCKNATCSHAFDKRSQTKKKRVFVRLLCIRECEIGQIEGLEYGGVDFSIHSKPFCQKFRISRQRRSADIKKFILNERA